MHPLEFIQEPSRESAAVIVPMLIEMIRPSSVLDVGCGTGEWSATFPVPVLGIDEHPPEHVTGEYEQHDLTAPFDLGRFDLALCLEVGEHIPAEHTADLVASLVRAAPVVVFSAAIPGQPGHGHVNCQWPSYWRRMFDVHGYRQFDALRGLIWDDDRVAKWYRQNSFVYSADREFSAAPPTDVVHPAYVGTMPSRSEPSGLGALLRALPAAAVKTARYRQRKARRGSG